MRHLHYFFIVVLLLGCESNVQYVGYESFPHGWHKDKQVSFQVETSDTLSKKNMFIMLRNDEQYDFSNLFLITEIESPTHKTIVDTLEYEMASPEGKWLGYGYSSVKESKLWFKEGFVFSEKGKYSIRIAHAMRKIGENQGVESLKGITEVGLQIEK